MLCCQSLRMLVVDWSCYVWSAPRTICWWNRNSSWTRKDWNRKKNDRRCIMKAMIKVEQLIRVIAGRAVQGGWCSRYSNGSWQSGRSDRRSACHCVYGQSFNAAYLQSSTVYWAHCLQNVGSEHYVTIMSFVDKEQLEPGCAVLLNHKTHSVRWWCSAVQQSMI